METEKFDQHVFKIPQQDPPVDASKSRVFSAQRMKYSAEVQIIKGKYGDLESMRKTLGLSQRKMSQLLLVDPSAWTRWIREDGSAPPHIYRALSWFLLLNEKVPGMTPYQWLQGVSRPQLPAHEIQGLKTRLERELLGDFNHRLENKEKLVKKMLIANILVAALTIFTITFTLWIK